MILTPTFVNLLEIEIYYLQQNINKLVSYELNHFHISILLLLFIGGVFTSINPCLLSIVPLSLSYIIDSKQQYKKNIFIAGLVTSMITMIIFTTLLNSYYQELIKATPIISSISMIIIGLSLLQIIKIEITSIIKNPILISHDFIFNNYIKGFIIGISSSTCSTPILINILFWISYSNNLLLGIIYICFYLTGYTLPLIILMNITINYIQLDIIQKIWNYIVPLNGSIILGIGVFSLLDINWG